MSDALKVLRSVLGRQVVSYHPVFARALGSVPAAVMLSQGFFWQESSTHRDLKDFDGCAYFSKTVEEWYEATGVNRDAQQTAREVLKSTGFWFEQLRGLPAKMYYHVDINLLISAVSKYLETGITIPAASRAQMLHNQRAKTGKFKTSSRRKQVDGKPVNKATENPSTSTRQTRQQVDGKPVGIVDGKPVSKLTGNPSTIYKVETNKESLESVCERRTRAKKPTLVGMRKKPVGQKTPPSSAAPPSLFFSESSWALASSEEWSESFRAAVDGIQADPAWYLNRVKDWSAEKGGTSKDWVATAARFAKDDLVKNKLVTIQQIHNVISNRTQHNPTTGPSGSRATNCGPIVDTDEVLARTARIIARRNGQRV